MWSNQVNCSGKQTGVSLIEIMLVLALCAMMIALGLRQYQMYNTDKDVREVQATVDLLFQSLANYYRMNCRGGTLDPASTPPNPFPIPITGSNSLVESNYLMSRQWPPILNGLVNREGGDNGYVTQLNLTNSTRASPQAIFTTWGLPSSPPTIILQTTGTIYLWQAQVSVALAPGLNAEVYRARLGADCTSTLKKGLVDPCSLNHHGNYIVWERLPSYAAPNATAGSWIAMSRVRQFNQLYTNDDMYAASNAGWGSASNNYLCGE
jgi:type II secretory pathway pseudopilin PulG